MNSKKKHQKKKDYTQLNLEKLEYRIGRTAKNPPTPTCCICVSGNLLFRESTSELSRRTIRFDEPKSPGSCRKGKQGNDQKLAHDTPAAMRAETPILGAADSGFPTKLVDTVEVITVIKFK